jgi:tripartite-type tricarboxylate transporter receptor subunit TctC
MGIADPEFAANLAKLGLRRSELHGNDQLQNYVRSELNKWKPLVKEIGLRE